MNPIQQFDALVDAEKWEKALTLIETIIGMNPSVATSWFNKGVCLDGLHRYTEAAESFIKAQEIELYDVGIHYRIYRSLMLAQKFTLFCEFADYSIGLIPEIAITLKSDPEFDSFLNRNEMVAILAKHAV